jgi:hypothetical protein
MRDHHRLLEFLENLIAGVMVGTAVLMPFFKPAVSIGMVSLFGLSLLRLSLHGSRRTTMMQVGLPSWQWIVYALLLGWIILSIAWSSETGSAFRQIYYLGPMLLVPVSILVNADLIGRHFRLIFRAALLGCVGAGLVTLWYVFFPEQIPVGEGYHWLIKKLPAPRNFEKFGAFSPFVDRLYFSYLTGFLVLGLWLRLGVFRQNWPEYLALIVLLPLLLVLGGRGAQLALVAGLLLSGITRLLSTNRAEERVPLWRLAFSGLGFLVAVSLLVYGLTQTPRYAQIRWELEAYRQSPEDHDRIANHTVLLRLLSWTHNMRLIGQHPWTGVGVGDYHRAMQVAYDRAGLHIPVHSNQQYLYFGVIGGVPALGLFLLFFLGSGRSVWREDGHAGKRGRVLVAAVWPYLGTVMLLDSPLLYEMPAFLMLAVWMGVNCVRPLELRSQTPAVD